MNEPETSPKPQWDDSPPGAGEGLGPGTGSLMIGLFSLLVGWIPLLGIAVLFPAFVGFYFGVMSLLEDDPRKQESKLVCWGGLVTNLLAILLIPGIYIWLY